MSRNASSEIYLHITWHTKSSVDSISPEIENKLYEFIRNYSTHEIHALGGTQNHVHLAVSISPSTTISEWIGQLKGACAHHINNRIANRKVLEWQSGYGVVSFGKKDLPWVVDYIRDQKEHHADGKTHDRLETIEGPLKASAK
jgi:putative transposase